MTFTDVTTASGITFVHNNGRAGQKYLPETMGTGGAFVDLNNDGRLDIVLINGRDWKAGGRKTLPALYKNNGNATFTDVVAGAGSTYRCMGWVLPPAITTTTVATISM